MMYDYFNNYFKDFFNNFFKDLEDSFKDIYRDMTPEHLNLILYAI